MAFQSVHTALKAVRGVCVCIYVVLVFVMSVTPSSLGSARRVQLGKNVMAQVGGLVDCLKKTGASAPAARAAMPGPGSRSWVWHMAGSSRAWDGIFPASI